MTPTPALILWDIDRTLVDSGRVGRDMYARALHEVAGLRLRAMAEVAGRTEKAILLETLALHGITGPEIEFDRFYAALARAAEGLRETMRRRGRRLPGSREAIAALARDGVVQTVVTGNIKPVAVTKLEVFGLSEHLDIDVGGYGSDDSTRATLVRLAWRRAERKYGHAFPPERVVVIGDTPHDMRAAREVGVHAVGVATGTSTAEDLAAHTDTVVTDLTDTRAFVAAVFGMAPRRSPIHDGRDAARSSGVQDRS